MSALICGSMAYDSIMVFHDRFKNHILPDQLHILNVAFLVPDMRREFGGCAGNIAYNLHLLGGHPLIMATMGEDDSLYRRRLTELGIAQNHIRTIPHTFTAQAFITTDLDDNQITAFHPGAMSFAHTNHVKDAENVTIGIVSPDGREGMVNHLREFHDAGIPCIFDPGQGLPMFNGEELLEMLKLATYCTVNDYEGKLLSDRTGKSLEELAKEVKALIVTLGGEGAQIYTEGRIINIPPAKVDQIIDPTGCGDAFRAGLLYGLENNFSWEKTGRLGCLMGAIKIMSRGGQNHEISKAEISRLFTENYGETL